MAESFIFAKYGISIIMPSINPLNTTLSELDHKPPSPTDSLLPFSLSLYQCSSTSKCAETGDIKSKYQKNLYIKSKNENLPKIKQNHKKNNHGSQNKNLLSNNIHHQLPISSSSHPLETSITLYHRSKIIETYNNHSFTIPKNISDVDGSIIPSIDYQSFRQLLQHGSPVNDLIIHGFLSLLHKQNKTFSPKIQIFIASYVHRDGT
jgi:hypothetical protein